MTIQDRRRRERERRIESIIGAAEAVIFAGGIERATMQQIADAAELNKATLYLYFANKDDLLHAVIERGIVILLGIFRETVRPGASG